MKYASRITVPSIVCPGVFFEIKKMTEKRRVAREMTLADLRVTVQTQSKTLNELLARKATEDPLLTLEELAIEKAAEEYEASAVGLDTVNKEIAVEYEGMKTLLSALKAERQKNRDLRGALPAIAAGEIARANAEFDSTLNAEWYPAWIKWGLHAITGLDIDDVPATVDTLIDSGPPELVTEIFTAIQDASGLSAAKTGNLQSPGSSGDQADGAMNSSTAPSAEPPTGTVSEIAPSTSLAT